VDDASAVVNDTMKTLIEHSPGTQANMDQMISMLEGFGR
jgi:hypothetical protein